MNQPDASQKRLCAAKRLIRQWYQTDNTAVKVGMVDGDTAPGHHLLQMEQAQGISQITADAPGNDIDGIMQAFKRFLDKGHGQKTLQIKQYVT